MRATLSAAIVALGLVGCGAGVSTVEPVAVASPRPAARADGEGTARTPPRNTLDAPGAFAIVEPDAGWLILADEVKEELLASPPFDATPPKATGHVVEAKLKLADLGPEMRLEGRSFVLYEGAERKCVVRAGVIRAVGYTADDVTSGDGSEAPPAKTPEEAARALWGISNTFVAAKVDLAPACKGATWGRLEELPEPRFAIARPPAGPVADKAIAAFRASTRWHATQTNYLDGNDGAPRADAATWEDLANVTLTELSAPFAGGAFVLRQSVWDEGCGASGALTMVWRDADGKLTPQFEEEDRFSLDVAMDLDGDGMLEMFGADGDGAELRPFWGTEREGTREGPLLWHGYAFHGCRC